MKLFLFLVPFALIACGPGNDNDNDNDDDNTPSDSANTNEGTLPTGPTTPTQATDEFVQDDMAEVDILFVVDNSCSMAEEQALLAGNSPVLMNYFLGSGLDYHIGVVSMDMYDAAHSGRLQDAAGVRYIDDQTLDPISVFTNMAMLGTSGNAFEAGRDAGYAALVTHAAGHNAGFLRGTSSLHLVMLSDEDDQSSLISNVDWVAWLQAEQAVRPDVTLTSIVVPPSGGPFAGLDYIDATNAVGGILWDINDGDYDEALDQIGLMGSGLAREFFLTQLPELGTIEVEVDEDGVLFSFQEALDWDYVVDTNSILFLEYIPSPGAIVRVTYKIEGAI